MTKNENEPSRGTILIVDDTPENLHLLSSMLKDHGYAVRAMINGEMAIKSVQIAPPDIILLDINMPGITGYEVCRRLKASSHTESIPIIFISALGEVMNKIEAFEVGGIDYITKPFQVEEVMARVTTHLSLRQMQQRLQQQNTHLQAEITERIQAEQALRQANDQLVQLVRELEQNNQEMYLLNQLNGFLQRSQTIEEMYSVCLPILRQIFPGQSGAVYLVQQANQFVQVAKWGDNPPAQHTIEQHECRALEGSRVHLVDEEGMAFVCEHIESHTAIPYICVEMVSRGETLGLLHIRNGPNLADGSSEERIERWERVATIVADRFALALANIQLREQLREQSIRDPLTNMFNRRYLSEILDRDLSRAISHHYSIAFIMIDIDHFKQYNDTYGHDVGDVLLRVLSRFLQQRIHGEDLAFRYGGEEFLIILPSTTLELARKRAEALCTGVREMPIHDTKVQEGVTISLGVASFPEHGTSAEEVIAAADRALYRAKMEGRNRVAVIP